MQLVHIIILDEVTWVTSSVVYCYIDAINAIRKSTATKTLYLKQYFRFGSQFLVQEDSGRTEGRELTLIIVGNSTICTYTVVSKQELQSAIITLTNFGLINEAVQLR